MAFEIGDRVSSVITTTENGKTNTLIRLGIVVGIRPGKIKVNETLCIQYLEDSKSMIFPPIASSPCWDISSDWNVQDVVDTTPTEEPEYRLWELMS